MGIEYNAWKSGGLSDGRFHWPESLLWYVVCSPPGYRLFDGILTCSSLGSFFLLPIVAAPAPASSSPLPINHAKVCLVNHGNGRKKREGDPAPTNRSKVVGSTSHRFGHWSLSTLSIQDALRTFFQSSKNGDARLEFYEMYKKVAQEYDTEYIRRYNEDLNATLVLVRPLCSLDSSHLRHTPRLVCSLLSAQPSSSTSIRNSNQTRTNNR